MRRLIVKLSSVGDVIHTIPAFRALRAQDPGGLLAWLVEEPAHPIVEGLPGVDRVIRLPRGRWRRRWPTVREALDLFAGIRRMHFDQAIDFQGLARSAIVTLLCGATERIGFAGGREGSPLLYNRRVQVEGGIRHAVDRNLALARALGAPAADIDPLVRIPEGARARTDRVLRREGIAGGFVILHPSAGRLTNRYPPGRFALLGDRIVRDLDLPVVVTGSEGDRPLTARLVGAMREGATDLAGRLGLWEMAALCAASRAFVGGDTGPLHLAVAAGARVVGIYGGASPEKTGPYGGSARIVRSGHPCGRCYRRSCPDLPCMSAIPPDEVFEQVRLQAESSGPTRPALTGARRGGGRWR